MRVHDNDVVHLRADTSNAANNAPTAQSKKRSQNFESINDERDTGKNNPWLHQNGVFLQTKESFNRYIRDLYRLNQKIVNFELCFVNLLKIGDKIAIALKNDKDFTVLTPCTRHTEAMMSTADVISRRTAIEVTTGKKKVNFVRSPAGMEYTFCSLLPGHSQ